MKVRVQDARQEFVWTPRHAGLALAAGAFFLALLSGGAIWFFQSHGWLLWYGDAEAHLNAARRLVDSQTPGYDQLGTVWLPLLHLIVLPFAVVDSFWRSGLAGSFAPAAGFVAGGVFLFATVRRLFRSGTAALAATALVALNPNMLYLQSIAMTEGIFFGCLMALLYASVRFRATQGWGAAAGAGIAACLAGLTRYDGWFLIPFVAAYLLWAGGQRRWPGEHRGWAAPHPWIIALVFTAIALLGPLYWLAHNWYLAGDPLDFYRGPYSAAAIQGGKPYPGHGNWDAAFYYYQTAVRLVAGPGLPLMALAGGVVALYRRTLWPLLFLCLPPAFYILNVHSGASPIFVPDLWPHSWYNTRYGLAALPLLAVAAASLVMAMPRHLRAVTAMLVIVAGGIHWVVHPQPESWITWAESRANSTGRRAWMDAAADYLRPRYVRGSGIVSSGGDDFFGIYRKMGIPLSETFSVCNGLPFVAAEQRPELWLWEEWAVVKEGDAIERAAARAGYRRELRIVEKDEPVVDIYHRTGGNHGTA
jgi:hypothetical protein